jgi:hypothetical protein
MKSQDMTNLDQETIERLLNTAYERLYGVRSGSSPLRKTRRTDGLAETREMAIAEIEAYIARLRALQQALDKISSHSNQ